MTVRGKIQLGLSQINTSFSGAHYLPYSAGLMQSYLSTYSSRPDKYVFLPLLFSRVGVDEAVTNYHDADIVGFSLYSWNERLSLSIAKKLKEINPEMLIIFGGPQVPDDAEAFLSINPFIDVAVHGEGEQVFFELVESNGTTKMWETPGISYINEDGAVVTNPKPTRIRDLSLIPSPYLAGAFDELMEFKGDTEWLALWETNRGCPFKCTFCDWGSATQSKVNQRSLDRLQDEIDWFAAKKIEFIFCCDANFGILKRDVEIAEYAASSKTRYGYPRALSVQNTKNATERAYLTQRILSDAGLNKGVTLSMQSLDPLTLRNIKRENISLETYDVLQKRFTKEGIPTYSDLILALPGETFDTFVGGVSRLIANGQHNRIQFNNLSILPNAEMGNPEYIKKFGMQLVETKILNMHGIFSGESDDVAERQRLVIATNSMPIDDWRQTRAFCWMVGFLYFNKIVQVPLLIMHEFSKLSYRDLFMAFMDVDEGTFPLLAEISRYFLERAEVIQNGGPEYEYSEKSLGIWWPHDEFMLIELTMNNNLDAFYQEAGELMKEMVKPSDRLVVDDAVTLNKAMLKLPFVHEDVVIETEYSIMEFYHGALRGEDIQLAKKRRSYRINRTTEMWDNREDWCREVVWFGNKKGAYLYGLEGLSKYYAGHH